MANPDTTLQSSSTGHRLPLHLQISAMLSREIQTGILADGDRLPPERDMANTLGISVGTLRKALADLDAKGLLQRIHGSGNYVQYRLDVHNHYALFGLELATGGGQPSAELLSLRRLQKPSNLPTFGQSREAFRFRRLRKLDGIDAAIEEIWLDGRFADSINKRDVTDSLYLFYKNQLGFWITHTEDRVGVAQAPDWAPAQWQQNGTASCGFIERVSRDNDGELAEFSRTWFDPRTVVYVARQSVSATLSQDPQRQ